MGIAIVPAEGRPVCTHPTIQAIFSKPINVICPVHSWREKYFTFADGQISSTSSRRPTPARGAYRDRHERREGCGGRDSVGVKRQRRAGSSCERVAGAQDERRLLRTAKPCGP